MDNYTVSFGSNEPMGSDEDINGDTDSSMRTGDVR